MKKALGFGLVATSVALGTWMVGWWAVPVVALIAGLTGCRAGLVSGASAAAWLVLLVSDVASGNFPEVASVLAGIMGMPAAVLLVVTLALPALLGWSAASLGDAARSIRPTSRPPS